MQIVQFNSSEFSVRSIVINDEPWFVAKDVCEVLGLTHITNTLSRVDSEDLSVVKLHSGGQTRNMKVVNESGLYQIIFMSKKPQAKKFKRWVTSEVLPSIRKYGSYSLIQEEPEEPIIQPSKLPFKKENILEDNQGIDTIRLIGKYETVSKLCHRLGLEISQAKSNTPLSNKLKELNSISENKRRYKKEAYKPTLEVVKLAKGKAVSNYMTITRNTPLLFDYALKHKKSKRYVLHYGVYRVTPTNKPYKQRGYTDNKQIFKA